MNHGRFVDLAPLAERAGSVSVRYGTEGRDVIERNTPDGWEVERPWLWWLTGDGSDYDGMDFGPPVVGEPWDTWGPIYGVTAIPAVSRCTSIIVDTIAGLPWHLYRGDYERLPTPEWITDPQSTRVDQRVHDPERVREVRLSRMEFWAQWLTMALWFGDGLVYVPVRDETGQPRPPIFGLSPWAVDIEDDRYFVDDYEFEPGSIIHLRGMPPYDNGRGFGVLVRHLADLGLMLTIRGYASRQFRSGVPAGYLKLNAAGVTKDQAEDVRAEWMRAHGRGRRSIAVLSAMTDFNAISIKPIDAQLSDQRAWGIREIAIAFGIPAYMLGVPGDSATYANVESRMIELARFTHLPWTRRAESALDSEVPRGQGFKLLLDGVMRADTKTRMDAYKVAIDAGILTRNEARAKEDLPPLEGGNGI